MYRTPPHDHHRVLIVDDEESIGQALRRIIQPEGHDVSLVLSGADALQMMRAHPPCLVLLDLAMPDLDGLSVLRQMRSEPALADVSVIIVTGSFDGKTISQCHDLGVVDMIRKPFDKDETRFRVAAQINLHTAQLQRQRATEQSEAITRVARDAIIVLDPQGQVAHWNPAAATLFGYEEAEVIGKNLHDLVAPERVREQYRRSFEAFRSSGQGYAIGRTLELTALRKNGEEFQVELSLSATQLQGEWCAVGLVRDITDRIRAQDLLQESQTKFQSMIDNIGIGVALLSPNLEVLEMNRQMRTWFPDVDLTSHPQCHRVYHAPPQEHPCVTCPVLNTLADKEPHEALTITPRRGAIRHYRIVSSPILNASGDVTAVIEMVEDVTEQLIAEKKLQESEDRFKVILAEIPVGIVMVELDRTIHWANRAALVLMGVDDVAVLQGQPCHKYLCAATEADCPIMDQNLVLERTERRLRRHDGREIPILKSVHRVEVGGITRMLETFVDLTEQKRLESELNHVHKLEAVGQLAAGIAHEINTPTQFVGDSIHFLREAFEDVVAFIRAVRYLQKGEEETAAEVRMQLQCAEEEADLEYLESHIPNALNRSVDGLSRISTIVSAMKEFAHPDSREKSPADLNQALRATLTIARNEYKYVADVEEEYGEIPLVFCHLGDLNQVFLNLIVNAAHAIGDVVGDSGQRGTIRVRTSSQDEQRVRIEISDTGCGIPLTVQSRIFEPFFTTKKVGRGSGQGLAIARNIVVDKHGGLLQFSSTPGQGTTFEILLPVSSST